MPDLALAHQITSRLHELGVTEEQLSEAVRKGLDARRRCTPDHPPSAPGYYHWSEAHAALRRIKRTDKWTRNDDGGFSTVVSPDGKIAIAIATGDARTGREGRPVPTTKYPRGTMTQAAVKRNNQLSWDIVSGREMLPEEIEEPKRTTWWLLINVRRDGVWWELSCPQSVNAENKIDSWSERIIFPPLPLEPTDDIPLDDNDVQPIDIPLERR